MAKLATCFCLQGEPFLSLLQQKQISSLLKCATKLYGYA